jgi:hypothetical protein
MVNIMVRITIEVTPHKTQWESTVSGTMCCVSMLDIIKNTIIVQECIGLSNQKLQSYCRQQE